MFIHQLPTFTETVAPEGCEFLQMEKEPPREQTKMLMLQEAAGERSEGMGGCGSCGAAVPPIIPRASVWGSTSIRVKAREVETRV